jgi:uncharacterized membrane protein
MSCVKPKEFAIPAKPMLFEFVDVLLLVLLVLLFELAPLPPVSTIVPCPSVTTGAIGEAPAATHLYDFVAASHT